MAVPADDTMMAARIAALFSDTFAAARVEMSGGGAEPRYTAACEAAPATLQYTADFASSALHEAAHWCMASRQRRALDDFGYFYVAADTRSAEDQLRFEAAEVRTQAIECLFSVAARVEFHLSVDNLGRDIGPFQRAVVQEVNRRIACGLPARAAKFRAVLAACFGGEVAPTSALIDEVARRA